MIAPAVVELGELVGTLPACRLLGRSRATHYRRGAAASPVADAAVPAAGRPAAGTPAGTGTGTETDATATATATASETETGAPATDTDTGTAAASAPTVARHAPPNRLSDAERAAVLALLDSPDYRDLAIPQIWARELDCGRYHASISSMYRIARTAGQVRERRAQARHPAKVKPELVAHAPLAVWSWDITKLRGPERGTHFDLYVILDIFSRYAVGWLVAATETGELARDFIAATCDAQGLDEPARRRLTIHADRGTSMTSKPVSDLLSTLGIVRSHSRPHVSNDNPYSEANFRTLKYCPTFPDRFGSLADARVFADLFFNYYNHVHRHSGIGLHTPASVHYGTASEIHQARSQTLAAAYAANPRRFARLPIPPKLPSVAWINEPTETLIQSA